MFEEGKVRFGNYKKGLYCMGSFMVGKMMPSKFALGHLIIT